MSVDILAIGAHPDDVELGVGGTLLLMTDQGYSVCILDLTRGEAGSRGTVEERMKEADTAAGLLDVEDRYNAELPDGFQTAEFMLEHGFVDRIVHRSDLRREIARVIDYCGK